MMNEPLYPTPCSCRPCVERFLESWPRLLREALIKAYIIGYTERELENQSTQQENGAEISTMAQIQTPTLAEDMENNPQKSQDEVKHARG
jgi:hypothetical protein